MSPSTCDDRPHERSIRAAGDFPVEEGEVRLCGGGAEEREEVRQREERAVLRRPECVCERGRNRRT